MGREKPSLSAEQIYKSNQKKSKAFKRLAPVMYFIFLGLTTLLFIFTVKNSVGNVIEIIRLLDKDTLTGEQVAQNYAYLVERYGEWIIVGGDSGALTVRFVDIRKALFSGLMITYLILTIASLAVAVIVGKILFPKLSQYYSDTNQDMVNIATLQTNAEIKKRKKKEEDWF